MANSNNVGVSCQTGPGDAQGNETAGFKCNPGFYFKDNNAGTADQCLPCSVIPDSNNVAVSCIDGYVCSASGLP